MGALLKRTLPAVPLIFGLALPFYIDSGALEPTRFDGEPIWMVAHLSPLYYAMGALQWAVHGLQITPEPVLADLLMLALLAAGALWATLVAVSQEQAR